MYFCPYFQDFYFRFWFLQQHLQFLIELVYFIMSLQVENEVAFEVFEFIVIFEYFVLYYFILFSLVKIVYLLHFGVELFNSFEQSMVNLYFFLFSPVDHELVDEGFHQGVKGPVFDFHVNHHV